jgi:hypothetical protein
MSARARTVTVFFVVVRARYVVTLERNSFDVFFSFYAAGAIGGLGELKHGRISWNGNFFIRLAVQK